MLSQLVPESEAAARAFDPFSDVGLTRLLDAYEPPTRDWLRLNFIASLTGSAAGPDGTSETLTSRVDRRILGVIRAQADIILVGAQSVRAEGYRVPKTATLGIVTASGRLDGHRIESTDSGRLVILCPERAMDTAVASLPGAQVIAVPDVDGRLSAPDLLAAVRSVGYRSIVCEGGPSLAAQFVAAGLVDEVCLSTAPLLAATTLPMLDDTAFAPVAMRLEHLFVDTASALYARWVRGAD